MADEVAVAREEDVPSNRMLMAEIRKYRALYDKSCHEYKDQRVNRNAWQAIANALRIDVASAQQRYSNIRTKYDTDRSFFALEALAAPSTFFEFSSSATSSVF